MVTGNQIILAYILATQNSDPIYREIADVSEYSWGTNRTLLCCDNIIQGWEPELQIPLHRITDSASSGSVFLVVTEHFSASSDHAFL